MTTISVPDFFKGCTTAAEIKDLYRKLVRMHHPDLGGDLETMKALNNAYDEACKIAQRTDRPGKTEGAYEYYGAADRAVREAIEKIITLPNITIEVCGWWVWLSGDTRAVKDQIKAAGYKWAHNKGMWYYPGCPSKGKGSYSMDDIRETYGSEVINGRHAQELAA